MKEKIISIFGSFSLFVLQLLLVGLIFVPLNYLSLPWWVDTIIVLLIFLFRSLGGFICLVIWAWSFFIFVRSPFNGYSILYLVFLGLYFLFLLLPHLIIKRK